MIAADILELARATKGFMPDSEGRALYEAARTVRPGATLLEIGAWCGKSALYLGAGAQETSSVLFSLDHHHGSEENQRGWEHFDESLVDLYDGRLNTLPHWQRSISAAGLEQTVVGLVGHSALISQHFAQPLDLLFIDGGHGHDVAWSDYVNWVPKISPGGLVAIHDVFADSRDGGRPPFEIYQAALADDFLEVRCEGSLRILRRGVGSV